MSSSASRVGAVAQNAFEVARFGGLETDEQPSPFEVVAERPVYRLRRYYADDPVGAPVLLVPPMMLAADIYDVSPSSSGVAVLHASGADPWVVDFGAPEHEEGGLERNLADHVVAVSDAVERVHAITGKDVHLGGYSQGGMFCYQAAAYRRGEGIDSVIAFGSPVDTRVALPLGIPEEVAESAAGVLAGVFGRRAVPAWMSRTGFRLLDPVKSLRQQVEFILQLHDREALLPRERQRRFLMGEGWVAWPGPAVADFMRQFIAHNRMLQGGFVIEDRTVTLADIDRPVLTVVGEVDEIAPAAAVRAITRAAPRAEVYELALRAGHFGLVVGSAATKTTWPAVAAWTRWRSEHGELPPEIHRVADDEPEMQAPGVGTRLEVGLELAAGVGGGLARSMAGAAARTVEGIRVLAEELTGQLPRLARLGRLEPQTRVSLGLLLDEQARRAPEAEFFLFEDRAYPHEAVKQRVDNVVRGLVSLGVRQGEHVGVLMSTRPSGLSVVAALNRLGAVAVLMRPDGPVAHEAELGQVTRIVADPELAALARDAGGGEVLVLGGGGEDRELGGGVVDMERIDPDQVELPAWYEPNPGRAADLAFILFTGEGERTRANRLTNGRWALSAFATASAAALSDADTVYAVTPIYHPSGLLMSVGGAIAGGSRLAIAREFDPSTFWEEVRRYGITVASYTWTMLDEIAAAPEDAAEHHHPVRLFIGAGMPRGLWRRVARRFFPAAVLEFYASTEGEAILVNLSGEKPGCKGRPLPGSAEVRLAAYDVAAGRLRERADGFAVECEPGEVGMLLTRLRGVVATSDSPLRGLFEPNDAWLATGDLFRADEDGDLWLVDNVASLIRTDHGYVPAFPILDALGDLQAIDLAVVYGVPAPDSDNSLAIAAATLRPGFELDPEQLAEALATLPEPERPDLVQVVDEIPVTTWYRPSTAQLRAAGAPSGDRVWRRQGDAYVEDLGAANTIPA
ncbi:MAG TPA: alpha/beta fold hydrolase [Solirubrobacterales bacterium]